MIVAIIALVLALGGTSYAAVKISASQLKTGSVTSRAIKDGAVTGGDVANDSLTNRDIDNTDLEAQHAKTADSALKATKADAADTADSALTAKNADLLDGISSEDLTKRACTSQTGAVKGFARVNASTSFADQYTTNGVENPYSCSGGAVEVARVGLGHYEVRFNGNGSLIGSANVMALYNQGGNPSYTGAVSLHRMGPGQFEVYVYNTQGGAAVDVPFVIQVF
jgi:hypothetical protein